MKKLIFSIFFILFIGFIFTLSEATTDFWKGAENRNFIVKETLSWLKNYAFVFDWLKANLMYIFVFGAILLIGFIFSHFYKQKKKKIENNPLTGGKTVVDGSSILSAGSLPESEKKREEKRKRVEPFISEELLEKTNIPK